MKSLKIVSLICLLGTVAPAVAYTTTQASKGTEQTVANPEKAKILVSAELDLVKCLLMNKKICNRTSHDCKLGDFCTTIPAECKDLYYYFFLLSEQQAVAVKERFARLTNKD